MKDDLLKGRYSVEFPPFYTSRGTGEVLNPNETTVYDFMPNFLGEQFRIRPELRLQSHRHSNYDTPNAPFMAMEKAYRRLAEQELEEGNLVQALEAYKRALWNATVFSAAIASVGEHSIVDQGELDVLKMDFGDLEDKLINALTHFYIPDIEEQTATAIRFQDDTLRNAAFTSLMATVREKIPFDQEAYKAFVKEVRQVKAEGARLQNLFWEGDERGSNHADYSKAKNPEVGRQLAQTWAKTGDYNYPVGISHTIKDEEGIRRYTELAKQEPTENPRLRRILYEIDPRDSDGDSQIHTYDPTWEVIQQIREKDRLKAEKEARAQEEKPIEPSPQQPSRGSVLKEHVVRETNWFTDLWLKYWPW